MILILRPSEFNRHTLTVHKASFAQASVEIRRNVRKLRTDEVIE
jgi:hypothetical protein